MMNVLLFKRKNGFFGIELSFFSKRVSLVGLQYHKGEEYIMDNKMDFEEVAVGALIVYFRIVVYSDTKKGES